MKKRLRDIIAGLVVGLILAGSLLSARADDVDDLARIVPFKAESLWLMKQARAIIEAYQVDALSEDIGEKEMVYGAIRGMVTSWGDPYTRFVDPEQLDQEQIDLQGEYGGLGIYIGQRDGVTVVISPIEDTPAEKVGLKPGDEIIKVEDEVIVGWNSHDVVKKLRGKPDTSVIIWVKRKGEEKLLRFDIMRKRIKLKSVKYELLEDNVGYIRLTQFKNNSAADVGSAVIELKSKGMRGLVLDLRNNGGGLLNAAVDICDMFLDGGLVVGTKGRFKRANDEIYVNKGVLTDIPIVVLINEGSASASEIVAGALKDRGRGLLVGKHSFGKGSVQTLFTLSDGSALYVTIARYHTPNGTIIDHVGLDPDIEVEGEWVRDHSKDKQLGRAIEELQKLIIVRERNA